VATAGMGGRGGQQAGGVASWCACNTREFLKDSRVFYSGVKMKLLEVLGLKYNFLKL